MNENIENINDLQITTGFLYIIVNTMHVFIIPYHQKSFSTLTRSYGYIFHMLEC